MTILSWLSAIFHKHHADAHARLDTIGDRVNAGRAQAAFIGSLRYDWRRQGANL